MGTALTCGKHGIVNTLFQVLASFAFLLKEDETGTRPTKGLVTAGQNGELTDRGTEIRHIRRRSHHITVFERVIQLLSSN